MGKSSITYTSLYAALEFLDKALNHFDNVKHLDDSVDLPGKVAFDDIYTAARDSLIQRFAFCIELFWKHLKNFLEQEKYVQISSNTPRDVIREGCKAQIFSEHDAQVLIAMFKSRNFTSHLYKEEMADVIAKKIPSYFILLKTMTELLSNTSWA